MHQGEAVLPEEGNIAHAYMSFTVVLEEEEEEEEEMLY